MAIQYVVTEEEFMALLDGLKLEKFEMESRPERFTNVVGKPDIDGMHRAFHYRVVRWVQAMGFKAHRG